MHPIQTAAMFFYGFFIVVLFLEIFFESTFYFSCRVDLMGTATMSSRDACLL